MDKELFLLLDIHPFNYNKKVLINDNIKIKKLYDLFKNNILYEPIDCDDYNYLGYYYQYYSVDHTKAENCYLMACDIEKNNIFVMKNLGYYYFSIQNIEQGEKYYLMAFGSRSEGDINAILALAYDYYDINREKAEKYLQQYSEIGLEKNPREVSFNLAKYYHYTKKNMDLAEKYYLVTIENGNDKVIMEVVNYYVSNKNYEKATKYYLIAAKKGNVDVLNTLTSGSGFWLSKINEYYNDDMFDVFKLCIQYQEHIKLENVCTIIYALWFHMLKAEQKEEFIDLISKIKINNDEKIPFILEMLIKLTNYNLDIMKLHFDFSLNGLGYEDAKKDFLSKITS